MRGQGQGQDRGCHQAEDRRRGDGPRWKSTDGHRWTAKEVEEDPLKAILVRDEDRLHPTKAMATMMTATAPRCLQDGMILPTHREV